MRPFSLFGADDGARSLRCRSRHAHGLPDSPPDCRLCSFHSQPSFSSPCNIIIFIKTKKGTSVASLFFFGADDGARTGALDLGKVALYQMSYIRIKEALFRASWCFRSESNQRHVDFQSTALPTELAKHLWRPGTARTVDLSVTG